MKKMLFGTMLLAVMAANKTNAQIKKNLSFGPLVGFGHSWMHFKGNSGVDQKFDPVFNGGVRLVYSATPHLGFGLDGTFRMEGNKIQAGSGYRATTHLNYINLDPKLYYFFGRYGQALRPKIGIGPNFGFLVGGKIKETNNVGGLNTTEVKSKNFYNGFNFGLSGALGLNYRIKSGTWLNVDAVYNNGLSELSKTAYNDPSHPKSRSIFLNVGVTFGIGHVESKADQRTNSRRR